MSERVRWWPAKADEIIALNDEISCLARAGVPLIEGLREVAQDQPERLSQIALWLAEKLQQGVALSHALAMLAAGSAQTDGDGDGSSSHA